ncbi:MAG: glucose-6-phosphate isomerase [Rhodospirillales bacterium]|nr:glucose-6-phosphate isomerase [Rhodospirillales bacterium]
MTYTLSQDDHHDADTQLAAAFERFHADLGTDRLDCLTIAEAHDDLAALETHAARIVETSDDVLVLGIGGSSLAAQTLLALSDDARHRVRLHTIDNIDPETWNALLARLDPARSHVLAVSKSGRTAETLAQLLLAMRWLDEAGCSTGERLTVITEPGPRPLRDLADVAKAPAIDYPTTIGGRFSALSPVGMLPAMLGGLDAAAVRRGAASVLDDIRSNGVASAPVRGVAGLVGSEIRGATVQVFLTYSDRLAPVAPWWVQLWGESLGKDGKGSSPVAAKGATDQHSQLQLWRDGPKRHMVTVLGLEGGADTPAMAAGHPDLAYLNGRTLGDLFEAEREATCESLAVAGVPVRKFLVARADEAALGALFAHLMAETILMAPMIGVDAFGQPAVEDSKVRARDKLRAMAP